MFTLMKLPKKTLVRELKREPRETPNDTEKS